MTLATELSGNWGYDAFIAQKTDDRGVPGSLIVKGDPNDSVLYMALAGLPPLGVTILRLSVALLEAKPFPRHAPGETLHPGVESLVTRLGAGRNWRAQNFLRHEGVWVEGFGATEFRPYGSDHDGPWRGYQAIRSEFDSLLLARARSWGVNILQPHRAIRVLRNGDRISGAETTAGMLFAAYTIDASGTSAWLGRQLSLTYRQVSRRLIALYGYVQGECTGRDAAPCFTYRPDG
jgi:flavin-dependent dehydrogenase